MKKFKRIFGLMLAVVMAVMSLGAVTAFAAETTIPNENEVQVVNFDDEVALATDYYIRTDSCSFTTSAAGGSFTCTTGKIKFNCSFTPSNGSTILAVRLHDVTTGQMVREWQSSNGTVDTTISVTRNHVYIFEYLRASGTSTVRVTNYIYQVG